MSRSQYTGIQNSQNSARITGRRELFDVFGFCIPWTRIFKLIACPWLKNPYLIKKALSIIRTSTVSGTWIKRPSRRAEFQIHYPRTQKKTQDRSENAPRPCPYHDNVRIIIISAINVDINKIETCCLHPILSTSVSLLHDLYNDAWSTEFSY